jgi:hypothetical protein
MTRRPDPRRIYAARRTGVRNRIRDERRIAEATADHWVEAWEAEAAARGLDRDGRDYWSTGAAWILEQLARRF